MGVRGRPGGDRLSEPLVTPTDDGLYCPAGGFYIDPWNPVPRAVLTHAHADHACRGSGQYLAADPNRHLLRARLSDDAVLATVSYGQPVTHAGVRVSFHPAGHVLGSAQIRLEHRGEVWVVTGDYKLDADPTSLPFEPVRCHTLITESTFGLPVYRWDSPAELFAAVNAWWRANQTA